MSSKVLEFKIIPQIESNICWAAVAASISSFYDENSTWTKCNIVCECLRNANCCAQPDSDACNKMHTLDDALHKTNNLDNYSEERLPVRDIVNEIDRNRVIGISIVWEDGSKHYVVIYGYDQSNNETHLYVADPQVELDDNRFAIADLKSNYRYEGGIWFESFTSCPADEYSPFGFSSSDMPT